MTKLDRAIWLVGLVALVVVVVYWPTIVMAWKNRKTIATASDVADTFSSLGGIK